MLVHSLFFAAFCDRSRSPLGAGRNIAAGVLANESQVVFCVSVSESRIRDFNGVGREIGLPTTRSIRMRRERPSLPCPALLRR